MHIWIVWADVLRMHCYHHTMNRIKDEIVHAPLMIPTQKQISLTRPSPRANTVVRRRSCPSNCPTRHKLIDLEENVRLFPCIILHVITLHTDTQLGAVHLLCKMPLYMDGSSKSYACLMGFIYGAKNFPGIMRTQKNFLKDQAKSMFYINVT